MPRKGDRVRHRRYGDGTVLEVNERTALVEWDTYRASRQFGPPPATPVPPPAKERLQVNLSALTVTMTIAPQ